jgi:hypothetical protein
VVRGRETSIDVSDVVLTGPGGEQLPLPGRSGVTALVVMRHRH